MTTPSSVAGARLRLFSIAFLILFFELSCIRWFGSTVIFLTFFTNIVLIACFLGMSVGLLSAKGKIDFSQWVLPLSMVAVGLAWLTLSMYQSYSLINVDVGGQASPQQIFFGTEYSANDPSRVSVPIEVIAGVFFTLISLIFVGLGQIMGRAFNEIPDRIAAYTADIAGSIGGIVAFGLLSYLQTPPIVWFAISIAIFFLIRRQDRVARLIQASVPKPSPIKMAIQVVAAAGVLAMVILPDMLNNAQQNTQTYWSPYYKINYLPEPHYVINTNNIGHQEMKPVAEEGPAYTLPHLLNRDAGKESFGDVLIIGAGSGNDVQASLMYGASSVDAVEIDPVIQFLGRRDHPDQPYADPRVHPHLDDGRSFVKKSGKKYDLIIYALVDSLVLHSGYSSLRLESFLFTREALEDIRAHLKPGGVFAMYNFYRQGWVVSRLTKLSEEVFGAEPIVISLPHRETIAPGDAQFGAYTFILSGDTAAIKNAFEKQSTFWLNRSPRLNEQVNGFSAEPPPLVAPAGEVPAEAHWYRIAPAAVDVSTTALLPHDNWPFLYLRERAIPLLNIKGMLLIGGLSLLMLWLVGIRNQPHEESKPLNWKAFNWQMFFLGAGFMLLETKNVVHMALLFGSTWIVNSFVFAAILLMILISNLWVIKMRPRNLNPYYVLLVASLLIGLLIPMNAFLALPGTLKVIASCLIAFLPVFFAGVVFATSFRDSEQPDVDFGSNIAGIILGGLCEYFSLALGFNGLLGIAALFYVLSRLWHRPVLPKPASLTGSEASTAEA